MVTEALWDQAASQAVGEAIRDIIVVRSRRGVSGLGRRLRRLFGGKPSNLTRTGALLDTLAVVPTPASVEVQTTVRYASYVDNDRPFMTLTAGELRQVDKVVTAELRRLEQHFVQR